MFVGGAFERATIFALGIMPYISASIIIQLFGAVIPYFEKLQKEGEEGRKKITQLTRYGTVLLSGSSGAGYRHLLAEPEQPGRSRWCPTRDPDFIFLTIVTLASGTIFVMWLGEQITDRGIGNGISLIITVGIIAQYPNDILNTLRAWQAGQFNIFQLIILGRGHARGDRAGGAHDPGGAEDSRPVRQAGGGAQDVRRADHPHPPAGEHRGCDAHHLRPVHHRLSGHPGRPLSRERSSCSSVQTAVLPGPAHLHRPLRADDHVLHLFLYGNRAQPGGSGRQHAEVRRVHSRDPAGQEDGRVHRPDSHPDHPAGSGLPGLHRHLPDIMIAQFNVPFYFGGTGLLIVVGVMLDTLSQIESHLLMRHYDGFMKKGKMRSRSAR